VRLIATGAAGALICAAAAWGATAARAEPLDLVGAWRLATEHDATWQAAQAAARAVAEGVAVARADLLPSASASASRNRNALSYEEASMPDQHYGSGSQSVTLRQPLYRPASVVGLDKARAESRDADARREQERQSLASRVAEAYFDVLAVHGQLLALESQRANARVQIDAARKARVAGTGTRTDEEEAIARHDQLGAQAFEARQTLQWTLQTLGNLVQRPVDALMDLPRDVRLADGGALHVETLGHWLDLAARNSPELQALRARLDAAALQVSRIRAQHRPTLDVVAQWQNVDRDSVVSPTSRYSFGLVGLQLAVPLYAGGGVEASARQAEAERERIGHALEATRRDLQSRVTREWRNVTEGIARIAAFEQALRSAEQLAESSQQSFRAGVRTMLDVLLAQDRLATARTDLARARYLLLVSHLKLAALAGTADEALVLDLNRFLSAPLALPTAGATESSSRPSESAVVQREARS
jgi:outer membrane protein/protease secretion system outer membrane protein